MRQGADELIGGVLEVAGVQRLIDPAVHVLDPDAFELGDEAQVVAHRHLIVKRRGVGQNPSRLRISTCALAAPVELHPLHPP